MTEARGASAAERIVQIDALRGFALFGILCANILFWSGWELLSDAEVYAAFGAAQVDRLFFWHKLIIDGKFYTLFSTLFGLGFWLQLSRLSARGTDGLRIFRRRMLVLLGIGLVHLIFFWVGDILTLYALIGLLLPFVRAWSNRRLLTCAMLLLVLPIPANAAMDALGWHPATIFIIPAAVMGQLVGIDLRNIAHYLAGGFVQWQLVQTTGWPFRIYMILQSWRIPKVLGIMMIGVVLGRMLIQRELFENRRLLWWALALGLAIGVPASWVYALNPKSDQTSLGSLLGTVPLAYAYAAAFALAWPWAKPVLGILAAPGRMALTNYLAQTLLGIAIFYGVGFGLLGKVSAAPLYGIAVAIYAVEVLWSHLWLERFQQGPMEWLWRRWTYRRETARQTSAEAMKPSVLS